MKFGARFTDFTGDLNTIVSLAVAAEKAGFDFVWNSHDPFMKCTWATTAVIARETSRVMIGSLGTTPYLTDPSEVAAYVATLDELSGGRAVLGFGIHTSKMVEWVGHDASDYLRRTREATEIIRALLRGEVVARDSENFHWNEQCYLRFKPVRAEAPIYICPFGDDFMKLGGEIGDGVAPMITPPESAGDVVRLIRDGAMLNSRDVDIAGCAWLSIDEDSAAAKDKMRDLVAYFGPYLEERALAKIGVSSEDFAAIRKLVAAKDYKGAAAAVTDDMLRLALAGDAKSVIRQIEDLAAAGVTQVNLGGPFGPDAAKAIALMGERVIPHFC